MLKDNAKTYTSKKTIQGSLDIEYENIPSAIFTINLPHRLSHFYANSLIEKNFEGMENLKNDIVLH